MTPHPPQEATNRGLTEASYVWIVAKCVVGDGGEIGYRVPEEFPVGMLGGCCVLTPNPPNPTHTPP